MLTSGTLVRFRPRYDYGSRKGLHKEIWPCGYNSSGVKIIELSDKDIGLYISKHEWRALQVVDQEYLDVLIGETIVIVRGTAIIPYRDDSVNS